MTPIEVVLALAIGYLGGHAVRQYFNGSWILGTLTVIAAVFVFYQTFYA